MGDWKGKVDLTLATMDDFQVVLGIDFLRQVKDSKPHMNCIIEEKTRHLHASSGTRDQEAQGEKDLGSFLKRTNGTKLLAIYGNDKIRRNSDSSLSL